MKNWNIQLFTTLHGTGTYLEILEKNRKKLDLCGTDGRLFTTDVSAKLSHVTQKHLDKYQKIWPDQM